MTHLTPISHRFLDHLSVARRATLRVLCPIALLCLASSAGSPPAAAEVTEARATAPPKSVVLEHTRGGAYFVSEPLKQEYDRLLSRVRALRAELDGGQARGPEVIRELSELQTKLERLRGDIEKAKVLVSPLKVHTQSEEVTFDIGPERLIVITADHIRLRGWDGPGAKCVLEKTVLAPDANPVDDHLKGLKVVHRHGPAPDLVGRAAAEIDADEKAYLAGPDGAKLTEPQRKSRAAFVRDIAAGRAPYTAFQGKPLDAIEIQGLTHEQGNRQVTVRIDSPGGGGASLGSDWQRHAVLTVYVPPATEAVAVRGCLGSLEITGVHAKSLLLTRDGSHDRDYRGTFNVKNLHAALTAIDVPLDVVESVHGAVTIHCGEELANTGTTHGPDGRTLYTPPPRALAVRKVDGDLTARFTRSDLTIDDVGGRIDVRNEFGPTTLVATAAAPVADKAHRIVSEAGVVTARLSLKSLAQLPVHALTNCGTIRTDAPQDLLEETSFSTGRDASGTGRAWRGLKPKPKAGADDFFGTADRVKAIVEGAERSPGLDLLSRGGVVRVVAE